VDVYFKYFKKDTNHVISKTIISKTRGTNRTTVLEDSHISVRGPLLDAVREIDTPSGHLERYVILWHIKQNAKVYR
jgi:hypothetical protein